MNVSELITATEGKTLEFKRDLSSLQPILKTLVAFANTSGGTLVIGVQDDGAVVGIADALREEELLMPVHRPVEGGRKSQGRQQLGLGLDAQEC